MLRLSLLALALVTAGCASEPADEADTPTAGNVEVQSNETTEARAPDLDAEAEVDTTGPPQVTLVGTTVPTRGVVTDIESGDISCYLTVRTDDGATETVHADYSVCDSDVILERRVQIEYVPGQVAAESCQGDPECLETETVPLAVVAEPIGG